MPKLFNSKTPLVPYTIIILRLHLYLFCGEMICIHVASLHFLFFQQVCLSTCYAHVKTAFALFIHANLFPVTINTSTALIHGRTLDVWIVSVYGLRMRIYV